MNGNGEQFELGDFDGDLLLSPGPVDSPRSFFDFDLNAIPLSLSKNNTDSDNRIGKFISLKTALSMIIGVMIGSGIFASPGPILLYVNSEMMALVIWIIAGMLSIMGSLCYAELGTMLPTSGGEHPYLLKAYGSLPAFLYSWTNITVTRPGSVAIITMIFAEYSTRLIYFRQPAHQVPQLLIKSIAALCIVTLTIINSLSTKLGTAVMNVFTVMKIGSLVAIGGIGVYTVSQHHSMVPPLVNSTIGLSSSTIDNFSNLTFNNQSDSLSSILNTNQNSSLSKILNDNQTFKNQSFNLTSKFLRKDLSSIFSRNDTQTPLNDTTQFYNTNKFQTGFTNASSNLGSYALAIYQALWAYDGWNNLNMVAGEVKNPSKNLPIAVTLGPSIVMICYVFANVAYYAVLPIELIERSNSIAMDFGHTVFGPVGGTIIPIAVIGSTFGAANGGVFTSGRLIYIASKHKHAPSIFSKINSKTNTPIYALIFQCLLSIAFVFLGTFNSLVNFYSILAWSFYFLTVLGLLLMRKSEADLDRPFKVWTIIPVLFCLFSLLLVGFSIYEAPGEAMFAVGFVLVGFGVWVFGVRDTRQSLKDDVLDLVDGVKGMGWGRRRSLVDGGGEYTPALNDDEF